MPGARASMAPVVDPPRGKSEVNSGKNDIEV